MKINYNYRSNFLPIINLLGLCISFGIIGIISSIYDFLDDDSMFSIIITLSPVWFGIIWISCYFLFCYLPVEMVAEENTLTVKVLFRKTVIRYPDIESISIDHEFRKAELRGEHDGYYEILKITDINKKEYVYFRKLELDQDKIAKDPTLLTEQFEKSEFSQLKTYIEEHTPIMLAESGYREENGMKENYAYFYNNNKRIIIFLGCTFSMIIIPCLIAVAINNLDGVLLAFIIFNLILIGMIILANPPSSFDADDKQVKFSCLGRKTTIRYADIEELKLEHSYYDRIIKSGEKRYVETLTISTKDINYVFSAKMYIDYDRSAQNPALLTKQFEDSKFSQLKRYIEEHMK